MFFPKWLKKKIMIMLVQTVKHKKKKIWGEGVGDKNRQWTHTERIKVQNLI